MIHGNVYAVSLDAARDSDLLLWNTIIDACGQGCAVTLASASNAALSLRRSGLRERLQHAGGDALFRCLQLAAPRRDEDASRRVQCFLEELSHFDSMHDRLLVVDGAETGFPVMDEASLRLLRNWAEREDSAVLLFFRCSDTETDRFIDLLPNAHLLSGMGRLGSRFGAVAWEVFHWFGVDGLLAAKRFPLACVGERLEAIECEEADAGYEAAVDERSVLVQRTAFLAREDVPGAWQPVDGQAEDMLAQAGGNSAATMVLSFGVGQDFDRLARAVFELRMRSGLRLKIVIREVNARLRQSQEALALRLGANLVVPAEVSFRRFVGLVGAVQGQIFPHRLPASFDRAISEARLLEKSGYMPPKAFVSAVADILERSRTLHVQSTLLRLRLAAGLMPLDALRQCHIKRSADLCTADADHVYLFLYACRESDVDRTLDRLFGLPVAELFSAEDRHFSQHAMLEVLVALESQSARQGVPDLSADLNAGTAVDETPKPVEAVVERKGLPVERYLAPPAPTPRPLRRKPATVPAGAFSARAG